MLESIIEIKEETLQEESGLIDATYKPEIPAQPQYINQIDNPDIMKAFRGNTVNRVTSSSTADQEDTLFTKIGPKTYTLRWNPETLESHEGNQDPLEVKTNPLFDVPPQIIGTYMPQQHQILPGVKRKLQEDGMLRNVSGLPTVQHTKKLCSPNNVLTVTQIPNTIKIPYVPGTYVVRNPPNVTQHVEYKVKIPQQHVNLLSVPMKDDGNPIINSIEASKTFYTNPELFTDDIEIKEEELQEDLEFSSNSSNLKLNSTLSALPGTVTSQDNAIHAVNKQKQTTGHQQHREPNLSTNFAHTSTFASPTNIDASKSSTPKLQTNNNSSTHYLSKTSQPSPMTTQPLTVSSTVIPDSRTSTTSKEVENETVEMPSTSVKNTLIADSNTEIELSMEVTEEPSSIRQKEISIADRIDELLKRNEEIVSYRPQKVIPDIELQKNVILKAIKNNINTGIQKNTSNMCVRQPEIISIERYQNKPDAFDNQPVIIFDSDEDSLDGNASTAYQTMPNMQTSVKSKAKPPVVKKPFSCIHCKAGYDTKKEVDDHIKASLQNCMKFPCLICKTYFCNLVKFNEHMVNTHKTCKVCNEKFKSKYEYTLHEGHHKAGSIVFYTCSHCINDYKTRTALKDHMLKAHPGKPFTLQGFEYEVKKVPVGCNTVVPNQCVYCDRIYTSSADLVKHLRSHNIGLGSNK